MKKILLTALVLIATALVSYGQSKAYKDAKKIIDTYEQSVNDAKSCDELDNATINLFVQLMGLIDVEYSESEEMTEKEDHLIEEQIDRIDKKINSKKQQFREPALLPFKKKKRSDASITSPPKTKIQARTLGCRTIRDNSWDLHPRCRR